MIEIYEEAFLETIAVGMFIQDTSRYAYEFTGDFMVFANEQLYAQLLGWA